MHKGSHQLSAAKVPNVKVCRSLKVIVVAFVAALAIAQPSYARVPYPVDKSYEDSVRVVVLWTAAAGSCGNMPPVGTQTRDFVVASLQGIASVVVLPADKNLQLSKIQSLWPGKKPHVILYIDAGWAQYSRDYVLPVFDWAVENYVGVIDIGDDAAYTTQKVFEWSYLDRAGSNIPMPMHTATWLNQPGDSLWIRTEPGKDTLVRNTVYPYLNGIVRNASLKILEDSMLVFKPYGPADGRCEADPDSFFIPAGSMQKISFLGYQQGWNATYNPGPSWKDLAPAGLVGTTEQFISITAFQDSVFAGSNFYVRRGVALSFEPQFLKNATAAQQLVYDATMFASLAHTLFPPDKVDITVESDTIVAGTTTFVHGLVYYNQKVDTVSSRNIKWRIDPSTIRAGDAVSDTSGLTVTVPATTAHRSVRVIAEFYDPVYGWFRDTADIYVKPGPADKVHVESLAVPDLWSPRNLDQITLLSNQTQSNDTMYAFVRDKYSNLLDENSGRAITSTWRIDPATSSSFAAVAKVNNQSWQAIVSRVNEGSGTANVIVNQAGVPRPDTVRIDLTSGPPKLPPPKFSPSGGEYRGSVKVTLSDSVDGCIIWYTLNGSDVLDTLHAIKFTGEFTIRDTGATTAKAFAQKAGYQASSISIVTFSNSDAEGPHVTRALYYAGTHPGIAVPRPDTLVLHLSEKFVCDGLTIEAVGSALKVTTDRGTVTMSDLVSSGRLLSFCEQESSTIVIQLPENTTLVPMEDSVAAIPGAFRDQYGNVTPDRRPVVVEWGREYPVIVSALTLFDPSRDYIPPAVIEKLDTRGRPAPPSKGTCIAISSLKKIDLTATALCVYDALGNVVAANLTTYPQGDNPLKHWILWDGTNRLGRIVGSGTYAAKIRIRYVDGSSSSHSVKMGVRR